MEPPLKEYAVQCEELSTAFKIFVDEIPQSSAEVARSVMDLWGVSADLRELDQELTKERATSSGGGINGRGVGWSRISRDLDLLLDSLDPTLSVLTSIGKEASGNAGREENHAVLWDRAKRRFLEDEEAGLETRIKWYRELLYYMIRMVQVKQPAMEHQAVDLLRHDIRELLQKQRFAEPRPQNHASDGLRGYRRPSTAQLPSPVSPLRLSDRDTLRWASQVFSASYPTSQFANSSGEAASCYGSTDDPYIVQTLRSDRFHPVMNFLFQTRNSPEVTFFWCGEAPSAARIVFGNGQRTFWKPLSQLLLKRRVANIDLMTQRYQDERPVSWAKFSFADYETMILFQTSFLLLKHQSDESIPPFLIDKIHVGEQETFRWYILDEGFRHVVYLLQDEHSGGIRLEACAFSGYLKGWPVWTAFISDLIHRPRWLFHQDARTLIFSELTLHVFIDDYPTPIDQLGRFKMVFETAQDCNIFEQTIGALRNGR